MEVSIETTTGKARILKILPAESFWTYGYVYIDDLQKVNRGEMTRDELVQVTERYECPVIAWAIAAAEPDKDDGPNPLVYPVAMSLHGLEYEREDAYTYYKSPTGGVRFVPEGNDRVDVSSRDTLEEYIDHLLVTQSIADCEDGPGDDEEDGEGEEATPTAQAA